MRNTNILTTSVLSFVNSWIRHGRNFTLSDAGSALFYGGLSGYGFYEAKRQAGQGNVQTGVAIAYTSSSVIQNVLNGDHPLAYFRYGIGPLQTTVATPLAINTGNKVTFALDAVELGSMVGNTGKVDRWTFRDGVMVGVSEDNGLESDDVPQVYAQTHNKHVLYNADYLEDDHVWQHEAVHVIQNIQYQSFFSFKASDVKRQFSRQPAFPVQQDAVEMDVSFNWFSVPMTMMSDSTPYAQRWDEIEAANMGEDHAPFGGDEQDCGGAGITLAFNF